MDYHQPSHGDVYMPGVQSAEVSTKSAAVAILLGTFLGFLGAHRFYTGHIVSGLVQLFTFGGLGIWWLVDMIILLTDGYTDTKSRKLVYKRVPVGEKDWRIAAILSYFLGALGAHRFYTGRFVSGFFQLITFGGLGVWSLIDFIVIVSGDFKDGKGQWLLRP